MTARNLKLGLASAVIAVLAMLGTSSASADEVSLTENVSYPFVGRYFVTQARLELVSGTEAIAKASVSGRNGYAMEYQVAAAKAVLYSAKGNICVEAGWKYNTAATRVSQVTSGRVCGATSYYSMGGIKTKNGANQFEVYATQRTNTYDLP